jgi:nitrite reductase (NADH) small subunit
MTTATHSITSAALASVNPTEKVDVCSVDDLIINSGICALVDDQQVAIYALKVNTKSTTESHKIAVYATSNFDPIGKANVMYRGLLCSRKIEGGLAMENLPAENQEPLICSPLYKQHYSLISGECLEDPEAALAVYTCEIFDGRVLVGKGPVIHASKDSTHKVTAA